MRNAEINHFNSSEWYKQTIKTATKEYYVNRLTGETRNVEWFTDEERSGIALTGCENNV